MSLFGVSNEDFFEPLNSHRMNGGEARRKGFEVGTTGGVKGVKVEGVKRI